MSWGVSPWAYPIWDSLGFLDLVIISFPILGKFSTIISSSIFSWPFFLSCSSGTPMIRMLGHLTLSQRSLRLSLCESPCVLFVVFPLLLLIFVLCLIFINLINMCFGVFHLGFMLLGTLWVSCTWVAISFPI